MATLEEFRTWCLEEIAASQLMANDPDEPRRKAAQWALTELRAAFNVVEIYMTTQAHIALKGAN